MIAAGLGLGYLTSAKGSAPEMSGQSTPQPRMSTAKPGSTQEIELIVRDYLLRNPQILREMTTRLQEIERVAKLQRGKTLLKQNKGGIFASAGDFVHNPDGDIPVVEYFDYQCGYCKKVHKSMMRMRKEMGNVRFVFKEFPILGPESDFASQAAMASKAQGKYLEFHNALMEHRGRLNQNAVFSIARKIGLDTDLLQTDMKNPKIRLALDRNISLARRMGINGTPTIIIGDTIVPGAIAYRQMSKLVTDAEKDCQVC